MVNMVFFNIQAIYDFLKYLGQILYTLINITVKYGFLILRLHDLLCKYGFNIQGLYQGLYGIFKQTFRLNIVFQYSGNYLISFKF